jgi:hypothetical protein
VEEEPTKEEMQLGLFMQQFDLSLFAKFNEYSQKHKATKENRVKTPTKVTPRRVQSQTRLVAPQITKQLVPSMRSEPIISTTALSNTIITTTPRKVEIVSRIEPVVHPVQKELEISQQKELSQQKTTTVETQRSHSPVPPLEPNKMKKLFSRKKKRTQNRSVSPYDFLVTSRVSSSMTVRSSESTVRLPDKKHLLMSQEEPYEDSHQKYAESSEEEDNIATEIPDPYDVSPLVSHIKSMLKVLRTLTDSSTETQPKPQSNHVILSMSYLTDLDLEDESNQYAIVDSQGIFPLMKLFEYKEDINIRIGAATVLSILSRNSRIQLRIADEVGIKLLLTAISISEIDDAAGGKSKARLSDDSITFQCLICEILANCCERVKVRKLFRKNQGLKLVLQFLTKHGNFFMSHDDATARPRSNSRGRSSTITSKKQPNQQNSASLSVARRKRLNEELQIIYNASKVLWKAAKSKKNQEVIRRQQGIDVLALLLDNLMQYYVFYMGIGQNSAIGESDPLETPIKTLVPVLGTLMHCAENIRIRALMESVRVTDRILKVTQVISKHPEYGQDIELQTVLAGAIDQLCLDEVSQRKVNKFKILSILGTWIKQYEEIPREKKSMCLMELITSTMWHCSKMEINAVEILSLGLIPTLVALLRVEEPETANQNLDVDRSDKNVKVSCTGIMSNCARIPECRNAMHSAGVVKSMCALFTVSASTQLLVNCLDTLGYIADNSAILNVVLNENGMRAIWTMLRSDKPPVQAAAARAICNSVNTALVAAQIGELFVSGVAALVRTLETSRDPLVIGYSCQAIAKMSLYETNRAVLTEEGALIQLSKVLQATRDQLNDLISQMGQSYANGNLSAKNRLAAVPANGLFTIDRVDNLNMCNMMLNKKLVNILFVKANAAIAIGELAKRKGNRLKFYECGVIEPLVENLMLHSFLQSHFMANNNQSFDNFTMIEIVGKKGSKIIAGQDQNITNPSLTCVPPFTCNSTVCSKDSTPSGTTTAPDLDCHYGHIFRNSSYALSVLSEERTIAMALRMCNCVALLVKLLSSRNDDLQIAAATCASNIRRYHVTISKNANTLLAPPSVRATRSRNSSMLSSLSFNDPE